MLFNYLKIAYRNLIKNPLFSFINIFGLALGMAICLLILQYVKFEFSYDTFHKNHENIVRLSYSTVKEGERVFNSALTQTGVPSRMKEEFPEVIDYVRVLPNNTEYLVSYNNNYFIEDCFVFADSTLFTIFSFDLLQGNPLNVLSEPLSVVISESFAKKYFGDDDPIGKSLNMGRNEYFTVTGVFKDIPVNSHIKFDFALPYSYLYNLMGFERAENDFVSYYSYTYLKLQSGTELAALRNKFPAYIDKYLGGEELRKINIIPEFEIQKIEEIHLGSHKDNEVEANGNEKIVNFFMLIAAIILIIALVNYINLSTSRSIERAREVGMRKVIGGQRQQLIAQFLTESALINLLALLLALVIIILVHPIYFQLTGIPASMSFLSDFEFILGIVFIYIISTLLSGLYPSFILSSFVPLSVIKGKFSTSKSGVILRKFLVIGQFAALLAIMTGTFIIYKQIDFMQNQDFNMNIDQILVLKAPIEIDSTYIRKLDAFKEEIVKYDAIESMTASSLIPGSEWQRQTWTKRFGATDDELQFCYVNHVDYDFINSYELKLVAGRNFSKDYTTDWDALIINERAMKQFGFDNAKKAIQGKMDFDFNETGRPIIGVIADYHQESLRSETKPMVLRLAPSLNYYSMKIKNQNLGELIPFLEQKWKLYFGNEPMEYFFLDNFFNQQYKGDRQFGKLFGISSLFVIMISYLGLLGLTIYTVLQRKKEIGIRKVMGATTNSILNVFSTDFMKLVFISIVVAIPLSYYFINNWLKNYASRISLHWWHFALPALIMIIFALFVINFQIIKTARTNPANILRYE